MKYLALIAFAISLAWTWNIVHQDPQVSFETHSGIQEKLAVLIVDTVKAKRPTATDIVVDKLWTELVGENKVKAYFLYSFKDQTEGGLISSQIRGESLLERQENDGSGLDRWSLGKVKTTSDAIVFDEGLLVTPGEDDIDANPPSVFSQDPQKEPSLESQPNSSEEKSE